MRPPCACAAVVLAAIVVALLAACGPPLIARDAADAQDGAALRDVLTWPCPSGWVATDVGGCGPAVLLCGPRARTMSVHAAAGACSSVDLTRPVPVVDPDGGVGTQLYLLPDGALAGGWSRHVGPAAGDGAADCPPGWSADPDGVCNPRLRADCETDTAPLPGGTCTRTGPSSCPPGEYAEAPIGAAVVYVRAGAMMSGADGSIARPFATVRDGIAAATNDGWVLVAGGTYAESIAVSRHVHVAGACASRTVITPSAGADGFTVRGSTAALELRGVAVRGGHRGIGIEAGASARVRGVRITEQVGAGIVAMERGSSLDASDLLVSNVRFEAGGGAGWGLIVETGAIATVARTVVDRCARVGIQCFDGGSTLQLTDSVVRDTRPSGDGRFGFGLSAEASARIEATRVILSGNRVAGATAATTPAAMTLTDSIVRDTLPRSAMDPFGAGVLAGNGGTITASRIVVERNSGSGLHATAGGTASLADSIVRGSRTDVRSIGVGVYSGNGPIQVTRSVIADNEDRQVYAGVTGRLDVRDTLLWSLPTPAGPARWRPGASANFGAILAMRRVVIRDSVELGIAAYLRGSRVALTDVIVENVLPSVRGPGVGLQCSAGAAATLERVAFVGTSGAAIYSLTGYDFIARMSVPSTVSASDLFVYGVRSSQVRFRAEGGMQVPDGRAVAYGLHPADGSSMSAARFILANGGHGFFGASGNVTLERGVITGQLDAAGAFNGDDGALQLREVDRFDNANDEIQRNAELPVGASLDPPTPVCSTPPCT